MSATDRLIDPSQISETQNYRVYSLNGGVKLESILDEATRRK